MASMTTVLKPYNYAPNGVTYEYGAHTSSDPRLVIQKRKVSGSGSGVHETSIKIVSGTNDSNGVQLSSKISFEAVTRTPVQGQAADVTAALATFRDIVNSDEFTEAVESQSLLG